MWLQDAVDAVEPDPRLPFNWVRAYREGLYTQSEEAHKEAGRVGEPREPEMRLVLEGELTEAPAGATVRPPVQHSTAGPYQLPLSLLQQRLAALPARAAVERRGWVARRRVGRRSAATFTSTSS